MVVALSNVINWTLILVIVVIYSIAVGVFGVLVFTGVGFVGPLLIMSIIILVPAANYSYNIASGSAYDLETAKIEKIIVLRREGIEKLKNKYGEPNEQDAKIINQVLERI